MPTYDYECKKCGEFEHFQSIVSAPLKKCPKCGQSVRKLVTKCAGIVFKGSQTTNEPVLPQAQPSQWQHSNRSRQAAHRRMQ